MLIALVKKSRILAAFLGSCAALALASAPAWAQADKPNILVVWSDDIGQSNISAYTMGLIGYRKPNIDRIAGEGMILTDNYEERSWAAGRPSYIIIGQRVKRAGISGQDAYADGMIEHDMHVGARPKKLDELGIADNTIVHYSTDNGVHMNTRPDAGMTPIRGEKNTNWEGGRRVPSMMRWPDKIKADQVSNEIMHHMEWLPTFLAASGDTDTKAKLKTGGVKVIGRTYKVHLDGYNFLPYLTENAKEGPCKEVFYCSDDGDLTAHRYADWKLLFMEHKEEVTFRAWIEPWTPLRVPLLFNLRRASMNAPIPRRIHTTNDCLTAYTCWFRRRPT